MQRTKYIFILLFLGLFSGKSFAQLDLTLYNMPMVFQSMYTNPANTHYYRVQTGLPILSSTYFSFANTGFKYMSLLEKTDSGNWRWTLDRVANRKVKLNNMITRLDLDLLSFGFRFKEVNYFAFNATEKIDFRFNYPRDLLKLLWKGNGAFLGQTADFSRMGVDFTHWREYGVLYSRDIDVLGGLTVGGKLKYNYGMENIFTPRNNLGLSTDAQTFALTATGQFDINYTGSNLVPLGEVAQSLSDTTKDIGDALDFSALDGGLGDYMFKMNNHGAGIDIGAALQIDDNWRVSGSLIDLGFISWGQAPRRAWMDDAEFTFEGIDIKPFVNSIIDNDSSVDVGETFNELIDSLTGSFELNEAAQKKRYMTWTYPKFYLAGNYYVNEKNDAGLVFSGAVYKGKFFPAVALSWNTRVMSWFSVSATYSYMNESPANLGLGFSINAGPIQWYVVTDNVLAPIIPQHSKTGHVRTGIQLAVGRPNKDRDGDGIIDKEDRCPDDPGPAALIGCPDVDGDSIPDIDDTCPEVPGLAKFDGCPDTDGDDIVDSLDACPTVPGIKALDGCPDKDGDGITDAKDKCPEIAGPKETEGCPDKDGDTVLDMDDDCPEKAGAVDHKGCPDTDGDGLYDNEDRCVETAGPIDNKGCPYGDLDGDGLIDREDRCPDTPGPKENGGCPWSDTDGDGVTDNLDECPTVPGEIDNKGCPVIKKEEQEIIDTAFDNLEFESGKAVIRGTSYESLDSLASLLKRKETWSLKIAGHTDNVGSSDGNLRLSEKRSKAVRDYLVMKGVSDSRFIVEWFGESKPIYPNDTEAGRQKNRRVEMEIIFNRE